MGLFNVPMTYPPPKLDGFAVSGMLTPEEKGWTPRNFTHPPELADRLIETIGRYEIDVELDYERDWHSTDVIDRLSANLRVKERALRYLLETHGDVEILFAVFEAPDRLLHMHYKYLDPRCEHFHDPKAAPVRERAWAFLDEIDAVIGRLRSWVGNDGFIVTVSDHGFAPKDKNVMVNLALQQWGLLSVRSVGALTRPVGIRRIVRGIKKTLPRSWWNRVRPFGQSSIDWSRTRAFAAPYTQQGIYVNLKDREPLGIVPQSEYEAVRDEIIERFSALIDSDDQRPVADRIYRREDVMHGAMAANAPDLFPICRAYSYELADGLHMPEVLADERALPRGFHHMDGIFGVAGPGVAPQTAPRASIYDIAPTAMYLAGLKLHAMDGQVLRGLLPAGLLTQRPVERTDEAFEPAAGTSGAQPYSAEEEAQIEQSLRDLGYL